MLWNACTDKNVKFGHLIPGEFCFWREIFAILRGIFLFRWMFWSFSSKNIWKFVKNSHFGRNFWPYSREVSHFSHPCRSDSPFCPHRLETHRPCCPSGPAWVFPSVSRCLVSSLRFHLYHRCKYNDMKNVLKSMSHSHVSWYYKLLDWKLNSQPGFTFTI